MSDPAPIPGGSSTGRFVGLVLMSIGALWLLVTGVCTAGVLVTLAGEGDFSDIGLILVYAVPSAILGGAIYFGGRVLRPKR